MLFFMSSTAIDYRSLLSEVQPQVIRDPEEHRRALANVDRLMAKYSETSEPAYSEMIDLLATLISKYEDEAFPMPVASPVEVLRHLMEAKELSQQQLAKAVGISPPHLSNILSNTREITLEHARNFARVLGVSPLVFIDIDA